MNMSTLRERSNTAFVWSLPDMKSSSWKSNFSEKSSRTLVLALNEKFKSVNLLTLLTHQATAGIGGH